MMPILIQFGPFFISSYGICLALAFFTSAFVIWRLLRSHDFSDEKIFDNILVVASFALIFSRIYFVATHWQVFELSWLRIFLVWKFPGLSFWGAFFGGLLALYVFTKLQHLSRAAFFDAYGLAVAFAAILVSLGVFLDGSVSGRETLLPWAIIMGGETVKRHPVALYSLVLGVLLAGIISVVRIKYHDQLAKGVYGWMLISGLGLLQLVLAFTRSDLLYWRGFPVDQILATIVFIGPWGPLFVKFNIQSRFLNLINQLRPKNKNNQAL